MKWTNKGNFPEAIVKAITNDSYSKGDADFSVTELINPPQVKKLQKMHSQELVKDVSENIWMLLGTSVHSILEESTGTPMVKLLAFREAQIDDIKAEMDALEKGSLNYPVGDQVRTIISREPAIDNRIETEFRASVNIGGYVVSGAVDWYDKEKLIIEDYKVVTTWKYTNGDFKDYTKQLNMYKYLFAENGRACKQLRINAIFKDWKAREMGRENYPDYPVKQIDIPMWDSLDTLQYILDRVKLHSKANLCRNAEQLAEEYPCSDEDRWARRSFAVVKKGGKRATKVFDTKPEAYEYFKTINAIEYEIQDRSTFKRCEEYCDVSEFCMQYRKSIPEVYLGDKSRGVVLDEVKPTMVISDDLQVKKVDPVELQLPPEDDGKPKEEHIATITTRPMSLGERLKAKAAAKKLERATEFAPKKPTVAEPNIVAVVSEKEPTATQLLSDIMSKKVDDAITKTNEKHGYNVDVSKDLGSTLEELGI